MDLIHLEKHSNLKGLRPHAADLRKIFFDIFSDFFLTRFDHIWPFWAILDHFGGPEKKLSKVTSKNSGTLTGRLNDSHLCQKNDPQNFQKKLKKVTFEFHVISRYDMR